MAPALSSRVMIRASAQHIAKQAVELTASAHVVTADPTNDAERTWALGNIAAIRRELDELEGLLRPVQAQLQVVA